ncbi:telomere repeat binding factor family protein [Aspergillus homomorphus CBS 101889]|uniref:Myb-like domain-containing protein n=1 Tax=Aspergillus homomorphus (strain CBS 101889) TaxID=1450537 RepID=A0A395HS63_ASPHC|nr:hypothetical protein BO97DRAFT_471656 [Aspergillus homomorphus CBS 101889]RAL10620.1 hypothetical protein BO97DRAFT_471656 [Aspergillus homomorphus CBS 101889]
MDSNGTFPRPYDESLIRELPQLQSLRIAPLRQPVSRLLSVPSPLEPNASRVREATATSTPTSSAAILQNPGPRNNDSVVTAAPADGVGVNILRLPKKKIDASSTSSVDSLLSSLEPPPPKPILPAFVNLRALERFPYSSFDDDTHHARKRRRVGMQAETFAEHLQLPIPQAQKEQRPPPFGPFAILNGLNEPPPNAALLPPIEAGSSLTQLLTKPSRDSSVGEPASLTTSFGEGPTSERREGRIADILDSPIVARATVSDQGSTTEVGLLDDPAAVADRTAQEKTSDGESDDRKTSSADEDEKPMSPKTRGRSRKNLRKWTEEETTALLRGVVKCGIGNWTAILAQPELKFNKRSASNLKDRFRVCCPWAYRAADPNEATRQLHDTLANALSRAETEGSDGTAGKIHLPHPRPPNSESHPGGNSVVVGLTESSSASGGGSSGSSAATIKESTPKTAHPKPSSASKATPTLTSKSKSTLASLGIPEPHFTMKSRRRSRRPFTVVEDEALLKGYAVHGFQWTLIQQDTRLNLGHRRATDLRDRFRTKFPHAYREGGSVSGRTLHDLGKETSDPPADQAAGRNKQGVPPATKPPDPRANPPGPSTLAPIDPALSPPAPPQCLLESSSNAAPSAPSAPASAPGAFPFPLDENAAPAAENASWTDNTLAPMVWDEIG